MNLDNDDEFKRLMEAKSEIYSLATSLGGTISAEHGIGIEKLSYIDKIIDTSSIEHMKRIKNLFDPRGILNPGKIFNM